MSSKLFYWLACIGLMLFAGEMYLFSIPKNGDAIFAYAFNTIQKDGEQIPVIVDEPSAHENVSDQPKSDISKPEQPKQAQQPASVSTPAVIPEIVLEQEPQEVPKTEIPKQNSTSGDLKLPQLTQDTQEYPRIQPTVFPKPTGEKPLQFIVFAFDGSGLLSSWDQTYDFAREMRKSVGHFSFTFFINPVYLLTSENKNVYTSPDGVVGASAIGFGGSAGSIKTRISDINRAIHDGHDIESHAVGHWDGSKFSGDQWNHELESFNKLVFGMNDLYLGYSIELNPKDLIGFRAPELATDSAMYTVLNNLGYKYDTSKVQIHPAWPTKELHGIWEFPLDVILRGASGKNVLAMDYNFYFVQTNAKSILHKGTPEWNRYYQETLSSYENYFQSHYETSRAPVYMANHFGFWNDGLYWEVMKQIAREECQKPDVFCGSYRDLYNYMELHPELEGIKS
jgi:peptidoglycan/xylan/chitin deacetylase (PgdA/CDA1 family)